MKRQGPAQMPSLAALTFCQAKVLARSLCNKTDRQLSEELQAPLTTIHRYFKDPIYHMTAPNIPEICKALGNNILVEWQVCQLEGIPHLVFVPAGSGKAEMDAEIADVVREAAHVMQAHAESLAEHCTPEKLNQLTKELHDLAVQVQEAILLLQHKDKS